MDGSVTADCCDGSDEHNGVAVCEDRCAEEGREIREALVKKIDLLEQVPALAPKSLGCCCCCARPSFVTVYLDAPIDEPGLFPSAQLTNLYPHPAWQLENRVSTRVRQSQTAVVELGAALAGSTYIFWWRFDADSTGCGRVF